MELWAGNEKAHRALNLAGLEGDVIAVPSGSESGGDLHAVFSCSDDVARVVLADCVGHGYEAAAVARHVHKLLHQFQDVEDTAALLVALNDEFTVSNEDGLDAPLRLTTVVTGAFDGRTGEFNFAYAAHPQMLMWRECEKQFAQLGAGLGGLPLGVVTGEQYFEQSVRLHRGDMILAFSDGATEIFSPEGRELNASGFLQMAEAAMRELPAPTVLHDFSEKLLARLHGYRGSAGELADDLTLMTLRRSADG
jgi:sigma-B regulation protein RsbU (phosphoserine phosphatase)